jgi:hypothetical protein
MKKPDVVLLSLTFADDTIGIMSFVVCEYNTDGSPRWEREATPEEIQREILKASKSFDADKLPVKGWRRVNSEEIPKDRSYRNALRHDGTGFFHDMAHARQLHLGMLRAERAKKLEELDREWMKATGQGKKKEAAEVEAKRQALRDFPVTMADAIEGASTTEELKKIIL